MAIKQRVAKEFFCQNLICYLCKNNVCFPKSLFLCVLSPFLIKYHMWQYILDISKYLHYKKMLCISDFECLFRFFISHKFLGVKS